MNIHNDSATSDVTSLKGCDGTQQRGRAVVMNIHERSRCRYEYRSRCHYEYHMNAIAAFYDAIDAFHDASVGRGANKSPLFLHFSSFERKLRRGTTSILSIWLTA